MSLGEKRRMKKLSIGMARLCQKRLLSGEAICTHQAKFGGKLGCEPREELPDWVIHIHHAIQ